MDISFWIQLIVTAGTVITGMFATVKYAIGQSNKKEKTFLDYLEKMQTQQLEYYEAKNGHLERISKDFTKTIDKNTRALDKLTMGISNKNK